MERLTHKARYEAGYKLNKNVHEWEGVDKLAAYENTGLTPKEIIDGKMLTGWIPVEEQLPKKDGFYLATLDGEICGADEPFTGMAEFENGKWIDDEDDYQCVLAWMSLPEPYRVEQTKE